MLLTISFDTVRSITMNDLLLKLWVINNLFLNDLFLLVSLLFLKYVFSHKFSWHHFIETLRSEVCFVVIVTRYVLLTCLVIVIHAHRCVLDFEKVSFSFNLFDENAGINPLILECSRMNLVFNFLINYFYVLGNVFDPLGVEPMEEVVDLGYIECFVILLRPLGSSTWSHQIGTLLSMSVLIWWLPSRWASFASWSREEAF